MSWLTWRVVGDATALLAAFAAGALWQRCRVRRRRVIVEGLMRELYERFR